MPTPMRPWTRRILELIDEGILDREEIIRRVTPFVPQGHAYRVREQRNKRYRQRVGDSEPRQLARTASEVHRVGARQVITDTIHHQVRAGYLVIEGDLVRRRSEVAG